MAWKPSWPSQSLWLLGAALILAGCQQQEQIQEYVAPKETPQRMLAVMVPLEKTTWFFKLMGPADEVARHVQAFDQFVASVKFTGKDKPPIEWIVPANWSEEHSDNRFYAAIRFTGEGMPLPITVTVFEGEAGGLQRNLDRWRGQLGLDPVTAAELKKIEEANKNVKVDEHKATRVDFTSVAGSRAPRRVAPTRTPEGRAFTFQKPADWEELPPDAKSFVKREAVFQVKQKGMTAQTTIVRAGGNALQNVNRWRSELGLPDWQEADLAKELRSLETASGRAKYVELTGRTPNGERATLGAWLEHSGVNWFITMKGPAELVQQQRPEFESFVKSFRFTGGAGAAHE